MAKSDSRMHEVTFCARVKTWSEEIFKGQKDSYLSRVDVEESKGIGKKRSDLRIYRRKSDSVPLVAGEVKMPGTIEGMNPYSSELLADAEQKASGSGARFFFAWNVNKLVLFDRKLWDRPFIERRVEEFNLDVEVQRPEDVERPEVEAAVKALLTRFYVEIEAIAEDRRPDWGMAPDVLFIRAFESHIAWPVKLTSEYLFTRAASLKSFDAMLQEWMVQTQGWQVTRNDEVLWRELIDRAARVLCYVFANRLIFYESVRKKFHTLPELAIPRKASDASSLHRYFAMKFQQAVEQTGDYETLFYPEPEGGDKPGHWIFEHDSSADSWRAVLGNLRPINFTQLDSDILGGIFQRLIAPEERHRFGQHYTNEDLVDLVNSFCIQRGDDIVLDPACGSGTFLVRAYHRKHYLKPRQLHQHRLAQIYGCDISIFAAHLSTLNLAARKIEEELNYPRITRRNFFEIRSDKPFCYLPSAVTGEKEPLMLPELDAVVGNPPYVRQELIPKRTQRSLKPMQAKEDLSDLVYGLWPGTRLTGRSDLHCYFWPAAATFLKEDGWFGFLVSSSWLDVDYGFRLQEWVLKHFRIHAIFESTAEPWFEDARVKTCAIVMQRCANESARASQLVKFVRIDVPLSDIFRRGEADDTRRLKVVEGFRDTILSAKSGFNTENFRVIIKQQGDLWDEGLRAGRIFEMQKKRQGSMMIDLGDGDEDSEEEDDSDTATTQIEMIEGGYGGGKWGKYLRAPDLYFEIMRDYGRRFIPLGEMAEIRFGVKSGCDKFFMPRNVTSAFLDRYDERNWKNAPIRTSCKRKDLQSGEVCLIEDGAGVVHPVEAEYLQPEVHSLMNIKRPRVHRDEVTRLVLMVPKPLGQIHGTFAEKYVRYGEKTTFSSKKSKAVPVPQRATCAGRPLWYDLSGTTPGHLIWPKAQQYRHIVVYNKEHHIVNCNLYDVTVLDPKRRNPELTAAVLNSTLVNFVKTYYGRYAGTEGNLKTEIVDVNLLEVPDPLHASHEIQKKLLGAFQQICQRDTRPMVEEAFMACRSSREIARLAGRSIEFPNELKMKDRRNLDLAVLELIGVTESKKREILCDRLYFETASHYRRIRIVEIQKQEQRAGVSSDRIGVQDLASDIWDALSQEDRQSLSDWLVGHVIGGKPINIPDGTPHLHAASDMFNANTVHFTPLSGQSRRTVEVEYPSRAHAELIAMLASHEIRGNILLPRTGSEATSLLGIYQARREKLTAHFTQLAQSRTDNPEKVSEIVDMLFRWIAVGR